MTAPQPTPDARALLAAECTDVHYTLDDLSVWCTMRHPDLGTACAAGRTEAIAFRHAADRLLATRAELQAAARRASGDVPAVGAEVYDGDD